MFFLGVSFRDFFVEQETNLKKTLVSLNNEISEATQPLLLHSETVICIHHIHKRPPYNFEKFKMHAAKERIE